MELASIAKTVCFGASSGLGFIGVIHVAVSCLAYVEVKFLHQHLRCNGLSGSTKLYDWTKRSFRHAAEGLPANLFYMGRREEGKLDQHCFWDAAAKGQTEEEASIQTDLYGNRNPPPEAEMYAPTARIMARAKWKHIGVLL